MPKAHKPTANRVGGTTSQVPSKELHAPDKRQVFFVSLGGLDTHDSLAADHPGLLTQVADALAAFDAQMAAQGTSSQVTTFTGSDLRPHAQLQRRRLRPRLGGGFQFVWIAADGIGTLAAMHQKARTRLHGPNTTETTTRRPLRDLYVSLLRGLAPRASKTMSALGF